MQVADYIDERTIVFLDESTKEEVLKELVDMIDAVKNIDASEQFYQALLDREQLVSTAIGMGVAIPHAKLPIYSDFFIGIAVVHKGIEWHAIDDALVRIVFLIGGPDNRPTDYLKILSAITTSMSDESLRRRLISASSSAAVAALIKQSVTKGQ